MGKVLKAICAIGFGIGACIGATLNAGMGMAGLAAAIVCGGIGAVALPIGLAVLALIGVGIVALGSYIYNKCCKPKATDDEKKPLLDNTPALEKNTNLASSLNSSPASSPKHSSKQSIDHAHSIVLPIKTENKKGFFSSIFCCFSRKKTTPVTLTVESDVANSPSIR